MDVLVTGGAGFVGTNFIRYVLEKYTDYNVVCIDKQTGSFKDLEQNHHFHFLQLDVCSPEDILKVFKFWYSFDLVINFVDETEQNIINSNIIGTYNLLEIVKKFKVKHFLQVSTSEVYGEQDKIGETANLRPDNLYCSSKASAELIALSYFHSFGVPVVVSRCSKNFGSFQTVGQIPLMITSALEGKIIVTTNDVEDWISVLDHCRALETLLHYGNPGQIYNVGCGNEVKNVEIAQFIVEHVKSTSQIEVLQQEAKRYMLNCSKIKSEFGWKPVLEFKESLVETIEWFKLVV